MMRREELVWITLCVLLCLGGTAAFAAYVDLVSQSKADPWAYAAFVGGALALALAAGCAFELGLTIRARSRSIGTRTDAST